jgi:SHS2 domain-containing protein
VSRGYRQIDHTADLALELWGDSEADLLVAGARAVTDILTDGAEVTGGAGREIAIDAMDAADRLVQWLNEIIVAAVADGFLFGGAEIVLDGATGLVARMRGDANGHARVVAELKSATYHDLMIEGGADGWRARVVIDV